MTAFLLALQVVTGACTVHWELRIYAQGFDQFGVGIAFKPERAEVLEKRDEVLRDGWKIPRLPGEHPDDTKWLMPGAIYRWDVTKWCCPGFPDPCYRPDFLRDE